MSHSDDGHSDATELIREHTVSAVRKCIAAQARLDELRDELSKWPEATPGGPGRETVGVAATRGRGGPRPPPLASLASITAVLNGGGGASTIAPDGDGSGAAAAAAAAAAPTAEGSPRVTPRDPRSEAAGRSVLERGLGVLCPGRVFTGQILIPGIAEHLDSDEEDELDDDGPKSYRLEIVSHGLDRCVAYLRILRILKGHLAAAGTKMDAAAITCTLFRAFRGLT